MKRYRHLSYEERVIVGQLKRKGYSVRKIAKEVGRNPSTISRELRRNEQFKNTKWWYAHFAQLKANGRRKRSYRRIRLRTKENQIYIEQKLKEGWSPQQIAGRMKWEGWKDRVSHEAIYQWIHSKRRDLIDYLAWGRRRRYPRGHSKRHRKPHIPNPTALSQRSQKANDRKEFGHWETDLAISRQSKAALVILVERKSRLVRLSRIKDQTARAASRAVISKLRILPNKSRRSITYDNGNENALHQKVNLELGSKSYFCQSYHSWEKGTVENTIGLIRRCLPKKTDFKQMSCAQLICLEQNLNNRPRKVLNFSTPKEVFCAQSVALQC